MKDKKLEIKHPLGLIITVDMKIDDILKIENVTVRDMNNGYVWYNIPDTESNGFLIFMDLCFFQNVLYVITFVANSTLTKTSDWSNFSEKNEKKKAKESEDWIKSIGYEVGKYYWGNISTGYDSKSGSGHGVINLKN